MSKAVDFMTQHQSQTPSKWRENAQWRRDNERWLNYSRIITMKILSAMDKQSITQTELAAKMHCTQQYVSNLLKGSSNMTLETISRIEDALHVDILGSFLSYSGVGVTRSRVTAGYLNDGDSLQYGETE